MGEQKARKVFSLTSTGPGMCSLTCAIKGKFQVSGLKFQVQTSGVAVVFLREVMRKQPGQAQYTCWHVRGIARAATGPSAGHSRAPPKRTQRLDRIYKIDRMAREKQG